MSEHLQQQQQQQQHDNPNNNNNGDEVIDIVLEMIGRTADFPVAVRKVAVGVDRVKLVVDLPTLVDAEQANLTAALVLDELDRLPPQARIAGILMASVQFTTAGANGLQAFLASHAASVRHVALHDILPVPGDDGGTAMARLVQVCQGLGSSPLQVLDVSRNYIVSSALWKIWKEPAVKNLEQIILDGVTLDTASWTALAAAFAWESLQDLHVVLNKGPDSTPALEAAQTILRNCTRLSSLRWIQRSTEGGQPLPCLGLREMAANMLKVNTRGGSLRHLVLGGSFFPGNVRADDILHVREWKDLNTALSDMPRLRTLKLRSLGINEVERLVATLRHSRPPLEVLDLSYNMLANVQALLDFSNIPKINKELRSIVLAHNMIDTKQARELFKTFGDLPVDVNIDNCKVDFGALIRAHQEDLRTVERERDDWRAQAESRESASVADTNEVAALRSENKRLRDERDTLARAFSIMGTSRQVEEQKKLLDRVQRLEDMVVLGAVFKSAGDRNGERERNQRQLDRRGSRRLLLNELPLQMERLRSVSSRSIGSANRSHSNRSQSTAGMTEDLLESPSVRSSSRTSSPAPPGALASATPRKGNTHNTSAVAPPPSPMLFQGGNTRADRRNFMARQSSREEITEGAPSSPVRLRRGFE